MDLAEELRRVEQPPFCASRVVRLSPEEIERLREAGEITPPERIPQMHGCPRDFSSPRWGAGRFRGLRGVALMAIEPEMHRPIGPELGGLVARRMRGAEWLCQAEAPAAVSTAAHRGPGFFVDFTGCEELLEEFKVAAGKAGLSPADSALDLIYLFCTGSLGFIDRE